jgi:hypothetical protein
MRFRSTSLRTALSTTLLATLSACGGTGDGITEPGQPAEQSPLFVYDLTVTAGDIQISTGEACDGKNIFGSADPGEFHYRVEVSLGESTQVRESPGYGKVTGTPSTRGPGTFIGLADKAYSFKSVPADGVVTLRLRGTEWDGLNRDDALKDATKTLSISMNQSPLGLHSGAMAIGDDRCGMTLRYRYNLASRPIG